MSGSPRTNQLPPHLPAVRGGLLALIAAVLFGISTPLVQKFGAGVGAFATAALLYAGAAVAGALLRQRVEREARVVRGDFPRLLAMAAAGAVVGPVALAWGLQRTSGTSASLMLTLEALFTAVLAWRLYRETMDRSGVGGDAVTARRRHPACARPSARRRCSTVGAAGRAGGHGRMGPRQHAVAHTRRARPGSGSPRQSGAGCYCHRTSGGGLRRDAAGAGCGTGPVRRWCHRLRAEPSLLPAGADGPSAPRARVRSSPSPPSSGQRWPWRWATNRPVG